MIWFVLGAVAVALFAVVGDRWLVRAVAAPAPAPGRDVIAQFWRWFRAHAAELAAEPDLPTALARINVELRRIDDRICAELGPRGTGRVLTLSADGALERFALVEAVRAAGPTLPGWTIVAFRQRTNIARMRITMNGLTLEPAAMKVVATKSGRRLALALYVPGFTSIDVVAAPLAIVLDHCVGEYDHATKLGDITVASIERAPAAARSLLELPALVDAEFPLN